jgi:hypothetical protein
VTTERREIMELVNIERATITLALDPQDCVALGLACQAAAHVCGGDALAPRTFEAFGIVDYDPPRIALYEALAMAFQAAAMAGAADASLASGEAERFTLAAVRRDWGVIVRGEQAPPAA